MSNLISSKLLRNLEKLSGRERARFRDFVDSPFFNTHPCTCALAHILLAPEADWSILTKHGLSEALYPGQPANETAVSNVMSYLMKLLEGFLIQLGLEKSGEEDVLLIRAAQERQMIKLVTTKLNKTTARNIKGRRGARELYVSYLTDMLRHETLRREGTNRSDHTLSNALGSLNRWYMVEKLDKSCELMALKGIGEKLPELQPELVALAERPLDDDEPLIALYQTALLTMICPENQAHYYHLKQLLKTHQNALPNKDRKSIYRHLLNYGVKQINKNNLLFRREMFTLYQELADNGLLLENGWVHQITYNNIISLACLLGDFPWAVAFLESHRKYLLSENRKNAYVFNLARISFHAGNYDDTLQQLGRVKFTNVFYQLQSRIFQIKTYYELGELRLVESNLENLRLYLLRSGQGNRFRASGNRFIRLTKALVQLRDERRLLGADAFGLALVAFRERVDSGEGAVLERDWLLEKLE